jgi:hypothetical protein
MISIPLKKHGYQIHPRRGLMARQKHLLLIYNLPNITISTKILLPHVRFKFYTHNTNTLLQKEAAERVKNQFLLPILDIRSNTSELFSTFSSLIKIHSIMIEVHGKDG